MRIGILALQGAFLEHYKMLKALNVDAFEIRQLKHLTTNQKGIKMENQQRAKAKKESRKQPKTKGIKMKLTQEQVLEMEILHNVYIDVGSMTFTHGKRDDIYGWRPIPAEWYNR